MCLYILVSLKDHPFSSNSSIKIVKNLKNAFLLLLLMHAGHAHAMSQFSKNENLTSVALFDPLRARTEFTLLSNKTHQVSIGQRISLFQWENEMSGHELKVPPEPGVWLDGNIQVGNRPEFNQAFFPNHWWRGAATLSSEIYLTPEAGLHLFIAHESIHPTAGLVWGTSDTSPELDGAWRTIEYNQAGAQAFYNSNNITGSLGTVFYFDSRNRPEVEAQYIKSKGTAWGARASITLPLFTWLSEIAQHSQRNAYIEAGISAFTNSLQPLVLKKGSEYKNSKILWKERNFSLGSYFRLENWQLKVWLQSGRPQGFYKSESEFTTYNFGLEYL